MAITAEAAAAARTTGAPLVGAARPVFRRGEAVEAMQRDWPALRAAMEHGVNLDNLSAGTEQVDYGNRTGGSRGVRASD